MVSNVVSGHIVNEDGNREVEEVKRGSGEESEDHAVSMEVAEIENDNEDVATIIDIGVDADGVMDTVGVVGVAVVDAEGVVDTEAVVNENRDEFVVTEVVPGLTALHLLAILAVREALSTTAGITDATEPDAARTAKKAERRMMNSDTTSLLNRSLSLRFGG